MKHEIKPITEGFDSTHLSFKYNVLYFFHNFINFMTGAILQTNTNK